MLLLLFVLQTAYGDVLFGTRSDTYLNWNGDQGNFGTYGTRDRFCDTNGVDKPGAEQIGYTGTSQQACQRACAESVNCNMFARNNHGQCFLFQSCKGEKFQYGMNIFKKEKRHQNQQTKVYPLAEYKKQEDKAKCGDSSTKSYATFRGCRSQAAKDGYTYFAWTSEGYTGRQDPARVGQLGECRRYRTCANKITGTTWDWALYKNTDCKNKLGDDKCNALAAADMCGVMADDCEKACKKCSADAEASAVFMKTDSSAGPSAITYAFAAIGIFAVGYGAFKHFTK